MAERLREVADHLAAGHIDLLGQQAHVILAGTGAGARRNVRHGVFVVENLDTSELAAHGVSEFAFILTHPMLRGACGAWTSPIAMV